MNANFSFSGVLRVIVCVCVLGSVSLYSQSAVTLHDFSQRGFDYGYAGWENQQDITAKTEAGVAIFGPAAGGVGVVFPQALDLSWATKLEIKLKRNSDNTARNILIKLMTNHGPHAYQGEVVLSEVSDSEFVSIALPLPKEGTAEHPLLNEVTQIQLQGTFGPGEVVSLEIVSVVAASDH